MLESKYCSSGSRSRIRELIIFAVAFGFVVGTPVATMADGDETLGTPTVAILGPTARWRNGPFNPKDLIVKRDLPCSNSYKRTCDEFICMEIPVQEVFEAVTERLKR